ncbi:MAG: folate-binding protein YgfZ [Xanthobacteraceae bacterium]
MKATLLPDRGVAKVAGDDAGKFLNGLITVDTATVTPGHARYAALLTPQGKIIADFIVAAAAPGDGGGFFLDVPRALAPPLVQRLNFYRLRAKVIVEDLSEVLGVLAAWGGNAQTPVGLSYPDPRLPELGLRCMLPPHLADKAITDLGARKVEAAVYDAHRIALGVPRGEADFGYGDAFPHEADMDQLHGVDFDKGCFVGQEVVSRMAHRGTARTRVVPVSYHGTVPAPGAPITAGEKSVGTLGSAANGQGIAMIRLDRAAEALAAAVPLLAGGVELRLVKPSWARFAFPGETRAAE